MLITVGGRAFAVLPAGQDPRARSPCPQARPQAVVTASELLPLKGVESSRVGVGASQRHVCLQCPHSSPPIGCPSPMTAVNCSPSPVTLHIPSEAVSRDLGTESVGDTEVRAPPHMETS